MPDGVSDWPRTRLYAFSAVLKLDAVGKFAPLVVTGRHPLCWVYMKKIYNKEQQNRSVRRFVKKWFVSFIKRKNCNCRKELQKVAESLQRIEESIEMIARQVARWARIEPGD